MRKAVGVLVVCLIVPGFAAIAAPPMGQGVAGNSGEIYPARYVRIITGTPGTMVDIVARQLGQRLSERWRQSVVVENRGGAGLTIGTGIAARATPDGYTILLADRSAIAVAPNLHKTLSYDPQRDLVPISLVALAAQLLVAHPSIPAASLREFLAYAKQLPGALDFAAAGVGSGSHISGEHFKHATGINLVSVHYKGGSAAILAILSGEAKAGFNVLPVSLPHVRAGKVRAYAITSRKRFPAAPDIPTVAEAGVANFEALFWVGMFAPARTPARLVAKLNRDIAEILDMPAVRDALLAQGAESAPGTPDAFAAFIKSETAKMKKVIEVAGIRAE